MSSWADFETAAGEFAAAGRRLLVGSDGTAIAFLATVSTVASATPRPHISPVCPIFCGEHLYLSAATKPKVRDLRDNGLYVLHAFLGENDEELQIAGHAVEVESAAERAAVHEAIPFDGFDPEHPIFRFSIERCLWVHWERVGQPDTKAIRRRWSVKSGAT